MARQSARKEGRARDASWKSANHPVVVDGFQLVRIVFRVDASLQIGIGHVMRCLTLADALRAHGADCRFVCREHSGNLVGLVMERGFEVWALPNVESIHFSGCGKESEISRYAEWLGAAWKMDAEQTLDAISNFAPEWLIVDHYAIGDVWETRLRSVCQRLMVIDDLADRQHDCDILLDQNLGRLSSDYSLLVPNSCKLLVGPQYALLRPEFAALRDYSLRRRARPHLRQLLVSMGGVDRTDVTSRVLASLKSCLLPNEFKIIVVMGRHAPWLRRVQSVVRDMPYCAEVRFDVADMAQMMAESDFAIGTAGTTSWERCCLGLPSLLLVVAENQRLAAQSLRALNAAAVVDCEKDIESMVPLVFDEFVLTHNLLDMSAAASSVTDGQGAVKVSAVLDTH